MRLVDFKTLSIETKTKDGFLISAKLYSSRSPKKAIFLVGALGVPQTFYASFAKFLAKSGYAALTFDYRGIAESRRGALSELRADLITWAKFDTAAALNELTCRTPNVPVIWIGHSLGGQIIPLVPNHIQASKFITIASGSGYWRYNSPQLRRKVLLLWHVLVPLNVAMFGYFAGKKIGVVGDIPKGVILQWRRWCMSPEYMVGSEGASVRSLYEVFKFPITSFSFTDDEMMSETSINSLHRFYSTSPKKMLRFTPDQVGKKRIGHFGFFRSENEDIWETLISPEL